MSEQGTRARAGAGKGTFGDILLGLGLLTREQLDRALELQEQRSRKGDFARLGHLLVELGFLTNEQVQEVLSAQQITILACEACSSQFNVRGYNARLPYECPACHSQLRPASELKHVLVQDQLQAEQQDDTVRLTRVEDSNTARIRQLRLLGKYEILGEIARGGMGIIYKARQLDLDRVVALKTLRQEELGKPDSAERFLGEAQAVARLRHPHIVAVYEVGTQDGIGYFTMEFIEGLPLDRHIVREAFDPRRAVEVVLPIAEALEYAHRMGVVHRDLKPANIILDQEGAPFLVDWGIAKRLDQGLAADEEEDLLGSIPYMAPEYVEGSPYDELCDLYSLGVVLYEILAGPNCLPYFDPDTRRFLEKIMSEPPEPIRNRVPDLDPALARIVERMIAARGRRFASVSAVVQELRRWLVAQDPNSPAAAAAPRSPNGPLVVGLLLATASLAWTGAALHRSRGEARRLEAALAGASRGHAQEVIAFVLEQARGLAERGEAQAAIAACSSLIDRFQSDGLPELAAVYRLRAKLRRDRSDPAADEDEQRARLLDAGPR